VAIPLVRESGVVEAIDDDDLPLRERWADDVANELRARRAVQERLGVRRERDVLRMQDDVPHPLADRCAAGLPDGDDIAALSSKPLREPVRLHRLAGGLPTFKGEEEALHL